MLTGYLPKYANDNPNDPYSDTAFHDKPAAQFSHSNWSEDGMPVFSARPIEMNGDKLSRPFETALASAHFTFSHGHLVKVASHDPALENLFAWEELWMAYTYWKEGFTLYVPNISVVYYNYLD